MTAPPSRHILRRLALAILVVFLALAVALAIYVHRMLQPQRFTTLLENDLAAIGLKLNMQAPAEPTLFPRPAVQLHGFSLNNIGSDTPVLRAEGATIVVPWRALLHGEVAIERIDVDGPRIDLGQLEVLLDRLPHRAGPPRLPTIVTGVRMDHGTLTRNGSPLLFDLGVHTGALAPGQEFRLDASARTSAGRRWVASMNTVPSASQDGVIALNPLRVRLMAQPGGTLLVSGHGSWRGGQDLTLRLKGTLSHPRASPPPAATAATGAAGTGSTAGASAAPTRRTDVDQIAIDVLPARAGTPMSVALKLDGDDAHVDMRLHPTELASWWNRLLTSKPGQPAVPLPFTGTAQVEELDLGWLKATGIRIDAGADLGPATGASTAPVPAPAASSAR